MSASFVDYLSVIRITLSAIKITLPAIRITLPAIRITLPDIRITLPSIRISLPDIRITLSAVLFGILLDKHICFGFHCGSRNHFFAVAVVVNLYFIVLVC